MLKENLCRVLSLFLCLTLFGGCGGDSAPQGNSDEDIIAAFEELLAAGTSESVIVNKHGEGK